MTEDESKILTRGDVLYVDTLLKDSSFLEDVASKEFLNSRSPQGTKILFVQLHQHIPQFIVTEKEGRQAVYHYSELSRRVRVSETE